MRSKCKTETMLTQEENRGKDFLIMTQNSEVIKVKFDKFYYINRKK